VDRTQERLGSSDTAIIHVRRKLLNMAKALRDRGNVPAEKPESFCVRSASVVLPPEASWVEGAMARVLVKPGAHLTLA